MKTDSLPKELHLAHHAIHSVPDAAGVQIGCVEGTVWLTLDGDERDIILEAGEAFTAPEHRRALIYAMRPSRISLISPTILSLLDRARPLGYIFGRHRARGREAAVHIA
jgi:hypothetical protein